MDVSSFAAFESPAQAPSRRIEKGAPVTKFLLGVNYWPRRSAMYMWQRFDIGEIREDMARLRDLGMHLVRFFLRWDDFQPAMDRMDEAMLQRFGAVMDAIADCRLQAMPTLFCGHMSGVNWLPEWSLDPKTPHGRFRTVSGDRTSEFGIGDFYADPSLLQAQQLFAERVGERVRDHPALYLWDLGNEFSNLRDPRSPSDAAAWSALLTQALERSSNVGATGGTHGEDVERDRRIRPSSIAAPWRIATMHGYSAYSTFSRGGMDTDVVPFYAALMQSFSRKPVLFSEFGNPACPPYPVDWPFPCLSEDEMATYASIVLERLHARGTLGALWWCWADYVPELAHLPPFDDAPHELRFGMIRADGSLKPVAQTLANFASESRTVTDPAPSIADEEAFYAGLPDSIQVLFRRFCES